VRAQVLRTNFIPLADAVAQKLAALLARFCAVYPTLVREYEVRPSSRPRRPHRRRARARACTACALDAHAAGASRLTDGPFHGLSRGPFCLRNGRLSRAQP
jgi:hypothetical protein